MYGNIKRVGGRKNLTGVNKQKKHFGCGNCERGVRPRLAKRLHLIDAKADASRNMILRWLELVYGIKAGRVWIRNAGFSHAALEWREAVCHKYSKLQPPPQNLDHVLRAH